MKKIPFEIHPEIYESKDVVTVLSLALNEKNIMGNNKGKRVYNVPCSFDIETTSFYRDTDGKTYTYKQAMKLQSNHDNSKLEKCSLMYIWQFGINGYKIIGRTWEHFVTMCDVISDTLKLSSTLKLIVYIHNLSYEFQFIRNLFDWDKVFSIDLRKPIYATTKTNIEFRCSYLLSGYSLAKLGEQLLKYPCKKKTGDLDYSLLRHQQTKLTATEIGYCVADVDVVMCYLQERIEEHKGLQNLPITKTGFVRKYCRKHCLRTENENGKIVNNYDYRSLISELTISGLHEFDMLQRAFAGGFTHANANYVDEVITDVDSYDFTSSYPFVMVAEQFPMSKGVEIPVTSMKQFEFLISKYCCVFDVEFTDIFPNVGQENPISVSKCFIRENVAENNGRVVCAKRISLTITDIDYNIIKMFYSWGKMRIGKMYCYRKGYLPTEFVKSILHLYEAKTQLKGVAGNEVEYLNSKEMLNSCYGMSVTNPLRDEFVYNGEWDITKITDEQKQELLTKYNKGKNRFLFYPWGVFVTAYARRNLFTGIYEAGSDYIYSDTDSIKLMNGDTHKDYFKKYNEVVEQKLQRAMSFHGIPFNLCAPKTIKGVIKMLGVWDYEGRYSKFKTLGAKRYMVEENNALTVNGQSYDFSLTVSGVNKKYAIPYLLHKYGKNSIFTKFSNYLELPPDATGKNIHTYIDYEQQGEITDYNGVTAPFKTYTGVHLEPTGYNLSLAVMFLNYLRGIKLKD